MARSSSCRTSPAAVSFHFSSFLGPHSSCQYHSSDSGRSCLMRPSTIFTAEALGEENEQQQEESCVPFRWKYTPFVSTQAHGMMQVPWKYAPSSSSSSCTTTTTTRGRKNQALSEAASTRDLALPRLPLQPIAQEQVLPYTIDYDYYDGAIPWKHGLIPRRSRPQIKESVSTAVGQALGDV
ncbi:hypothetical protein ACA910_006840 [Epithemia clementina (nom. ined.)]